MNKHSIWVKTIPSLEAEKEIFQVSAYICDNLENIQGQNENGVLKIYEQKIVYSIQESNICFIQLNEEIQYNTYSDKAKGVNYIKFSKKQIHTYIVISEEEIALVDHQLNKIIFKNDFYSSYDIIDLIGNGTYSQVSLARHKLTGKKFAVKNISKNRVNSSLQNKKELMNEINLLRRLDHKNILKGIEYFETDNAYKIVLEYYSGKTLEYRLQQIKSIKLADACFIMQQILQGLQYIHSLNIMHRDLKPENILLKDPNSFEIVIADIGFAQDLYQDFVLPKCGSPGYIAPEVLNSRDGKDCGVKTDMFSCGLLFYRLVVGKPLFNGKTLEQTLIENKKFKIDLSSSQIAQYPIQIQKIIMGMLQINPVKRISAEQALLSGFYNLEGDDDQYFCNNQINSFSQKSFKSSFNSKQSASSQTQVFNSPRQNSDRRNLFSSSAITQYNSSVRTESSEQFRIGRTFKEKVEDLLNFETDFKSPVKKSKVSSPLTKYHKQSSPNHSPILKMNVRYLQKPCTNLKFSLKKSVAQTFRDSVDNMKNMSQFTQKSSFISELR
ncbi:hypothetical protein ABPG74_009789 [Tetrahymena malaccensis]